MKLPRDMATGKAKVLRKVHSGPEVSLQDWMRVSTSAKIDFFEEMIELAYSSGALTPERLALRDAPPSPRGRGMR